MASKKPAKTKAKTKPVSILDLDLNKKVAQIESMYTRLTAVAEKTLDQLLEEGAVVRGSSLQAVQSTLTTCIKALGELRKMQSEAREEQRKEEAEAKKTEKVRQELEVAGVDISKMTEFKAKSEEINPLTGQPYTMEDYAWIIWTYKDMMSCDDTLLNRETGRMYKDAIDEEKAEFKERFGIDYDSVGPKLEAEQEAENERRGGGRSTEAEIQGMPLEI